jgi:hypothetical protein
MESAGFKTVAAILLEGATLLSTGAPENDRKSKKGLVATIATRSVASLRMIRRVDDVNMINPLNQGNNAGACVVNQQN